MTQSTNDRRTGPYACNAVTTEFAYDFMLRSSSELVVMKRVISTGVVTTIVPTTVTSVGNPAGGTFTVSPALSADHELLALGGEPANQEYSVAGDWIDSLEPALDHRTRVEQQLVEKSNRALLFDEFVDSYGAVPTIPDPSGATAGDVLSWDGTKFVWLTL